MKYLITIMIGLCWLNLTPVSADIPDGYYDSIDSTKNKQLKTKLFDILKNHTRLSYNDLWYYYRTTDNRGNNQVWDMYSDIARYFGPGEGTSVSGLNREHSFPKSWWALSAESDRYNAYTDIHHIYPGDNAANSAKSNYILGIVGQTVSFNNGVSKIGRNSMEGSGKDKYCFEPADEYKGDFARTYFYIVSCYEDYAFQWRSDGLYMLENNTYPVFQNWSRDMLLKWHREDPVSAKELNRNDAVFRIQNNRNPFVDYPKLAEYVWGDSVNVVFRVPEEDKAGTSVLVTPTNDTELYFGEITKNSEVAMTLYLKGVHLTGEVSLFIFGGDSKYFSIPVNSIPAYQINREDGYQLEIAYNPKEYGEHATNITIYDGGIDGSVSVKLTGVCTDNPSAIVPIGAGYPDVYSIDNTIYFRSYAPSSNVYIYDVVGKLVYSEVCDTEWHTFTTNSPGVYIISVNGKTKKLLIGQ